MDHLNNNINKKQKKKIVKIERWKLLLDIYLHLKCGIKRLLVCLPNIFSQHIHGLSLTTNNCYWAFMGNE